MLWVYCLLFIVSCKVIGCSRKAMVVSRKLCAGSEYRISLTRAHYPGWRGETNYTYTYRGKGEAGAGSLTQTEGGMDWSRNQKHKSHFVIINHNTLFFFWFLVLYANCKKTLLVASASTHFCSDRAERWRENATSRKWCILFLASKKLMKYPNL